MKHLHLWLPFVFGNTNKVILSPSSSRPTTADITLHLPYETTEILTLKLNETLTICVTNQNARNFEVRVNFMASTGFDFLISEAENLVRIQPIKDAVAAPGNPLNQSVRFKVVAEELLLQVLPVSQIAIVAYIPIAISLGLGAFTMLDV